MSRWAVWWAVPFGLVGSLLFARLFGVENNIYFQTGIIMLMGLLAKTAILLTVPGLFTIFQKIQERFKPMEKKEDFY